MMSSDSYKYHLQPYKGAASRHKCPQCGDERSFTLYVDDNGNPLDDAVGRCNHESGCGYHYTPSQFFIDNPSKRQAEWRGGAHPQRIPYSPRHQSQPMQCEKPLNTIPFAYVKKSASYNSAFVRFLCKLFDADTIERLGEMYAFGATREMDVIFWQIDTMGRVRGGKIMKYNPDTGHRIKDGAGAVDWVHARMKKRNLLPGDWVLSQCLFGEHLLSFRNSFGITEKTPIAIVESEKSAIIGAGAFPQYVWMASGGINNLNAEKLKEFKGRTIIIFPDVDGTAKWREKAREFKGCKVIVSDVLERNATKEERDAKIDIADWIISQILNGENRGFEERVTDTPTAARPSCEMPPKRPIWSDRGIPHMLHQPTQEEEDFLHEMVRMHPYIATMIDDLGLVITGIESIVDGAVDGDEIVNNNKKQ